MILIGKVYDKMVYILFIIWLSIILLANRLSKKILLANRIVLIY